jgi:hypothetical protein
VKEPVYNRLQDAGQEAHREAIDGPERAYQLERPWVGAGDRQKNRDQSPCESYRPHDQPHEAERFFGPSAGSVLRVGPIDR